MNSGEEDIGYSGPAKNKRDGLKYRQRVTNPLKSFLPVYIYFGTTSVRSYDPGPRLPSRFRLSRIYAHLRKISGFWPDNVLSPHVKKRSLFFPKPEVQLLL